MVNSNSASINIGDNNKIDKVEVNQQINSTDMHFIKYEKDINSQKTVRRRTLRTASILRGLSIVLTTAAGLLGIVDSLFSSQNQEIIPRLIYGHDVLDIFSPYLPFLACAIFTMLVLRLFGRYDSAPLKLKVGDGKLINTKFVERVSKDRYLFSELKAKCIYPSCSGTVRVIKAPPRELENHKFIGVCSVDKKQHSYTIDENLYGEKKPFDHRKIEKNSSSNNRS